MNSQTEDADRTKEAARPGASSRLLVFVAWTLVGVPLGWGIYQTLKSAMVMFR
jgi:hypothetical protein